MTSARLQLALLSGVAATCLVSIFAAQLLLALAVLVYAFRLATGRARWAPLPVDAPLLAFSVWTLLSAAFSPNPLASDASAKKLVLFALFYLAVDSCTLGRSRERVLDAALLGGLALGAESILQFHLLGFDSLNNRPPGFLGHYMTASGLESLTLLLAGARLLFGRPAPPQRRDLKLLAGLVGALALLCFVERTGLAAQGGKRLFVAGLVATAARLALSPPGWPGPATRLLVSGAACFVSAWALVLSQTRNAWLGAIAGLVALSLLRAPKTLLLLGAALALLLALHPATLTARLTLRDDSSSDRYYMWQAGIDMIRDRPVFGQGPGRILDVYPDYRWSGAKHPRQPHLHDNALQIAAERGLPGLAFWGWLMAVLLLAAWREARRGRGAERAPPAAAFAVLIGLLVAGLFEYNFGDSEVLMFSLLVSALPFSLRRERDPKSARPARLQAA